MTHQLFSNLTVQGNAILEFMVIGSAGAFMTTIMSLLEMCPGLPQKFGKFQGMGLFGAYSAFVLCGGLMAMVVGMAGDPPQKPLILLTAGAGWHSVLLVWTKLAAVLKSFVAAWKKNTVGEP